MAHPLASGTSAAPSHQFSRDDVMGGHCMGRDLLWSGNGRLGIPCVLLLRASNPPSSTTFYKFSTSDVSTCYRNRTHHQTMQECGLVEGGSAPGEAGPAAGSVKKKKGGGVTATEQTWPVPTVPIQDLFPKGEFPLGECCDYQGLNAYRSTKAELKEQEKLHVEEYNELREAAEVHRTARKHLQTIAMPGEKMIDLCESLENKVRELIKDDFPNRGIAFPTGCSINHVAAHWTPNAGDKTVLQYDDVVKFDFGTQVNGRIIDCAFTHYFNPK